MEVSSQLHATGILLPGKNTVTHLTGAWVGPKASLDGFGERNFLPLPGFEPWAVRPVVSRNTNLHINNMDKKNI